MMAKENAELNGLSDRITYECADVFEYLTDLEKRKSREFDYIILDPPAFTKSRETIESAGRGYKEINLKAMKILPRGGYLATCSCSHFMSEALFEKAVASAAYDAGRSLRQIEKRTQAPDHPVLWGVPETYYLKFYIFQVF
jgi:23S rRNA (cytosine1962-C5)-methyltransferase